ncbi:jg3071 [Pararge aegeria aegeria]|uniref:Jg3071 protein n=1 Tax=Pararge aegeria aegeria TaxID=348720 RepID=A0A8S4QMC0_9NEOP|nr:jg3071 [Pararge aegeria aegeria]
MANDAAPSWITPASRAHSRSLAGRPGRRVLPTKVCCTLFCCSIALEHYVFGVYSVSMHALQRGLSASMLISYIKSRWSNGSY